MAYTVSFVTEGRETECSICDYVVVYPFTFDQQGKLQNQPQRAVAFFNLITTQIAAGRARPRQTMELPPGRANFSVMNEGHRVLELQGFKVVAAGTPASLDRSRATWMVRGTPEPDVRVEFDPVAYSFERFGRTTAANAYWGAEIKEATGELLLRASLSVPVYDYKPLHLSEYFAFGPAGASEGGSIFSWLLDQSVAPAEGGVGVGVSRRPLEDLVVTDLTNGETNQVFGGGLEQETTRGAVFAMNGGILRAEWPTVAALIRGLAEARVDDAAGVRFLQQLPAGEVYQTVEGTMRADTRATVEFAIATPDFEGIVVWGLPGKREGIVPMHR